MPMTLPESGNISTPAFCAAQTQPASDTRHAPSKLPPTASAYPGTMSRPGVLTPPQNTPVHQPMLVGSAELCQSAACSFSLSQIPERPCPPYQQQAILQHLQPIPQPISQPTFLAVSKRQIGQVPQTQESLSSLRNLECPSSQQVCKSVPLKRKACELEDLVDYEAYPGGFSFHSQAAIRRLRSSCSNPGRLDSYQTFDKVRPVNPLHYTSLAASPTI